jgi:alcohol dehydrogenase
MEKPVSFSMQRIIANELEIIGSHGIQAYRYEDMLSFIKKKKIQISYLIQNKVNLETAIPLMTQMDKNQSLGVSVITSFE